MTEPKRIDRHTLFWQTAFLITWRELLRRQPVGEVWPGPRLASLSRSLADDCVRAAEDDGAEACADCRGVGCPACSYSGRRPTPAAEPITAGAEPVTTAGRKRDLSRLGRNLDPAFALDDDDEPAPKTGK